MGQIRFCCWEGLTSGNKRRMEKMGRWTNVPIVRDMFDREMDMEFGRPVRVFDQHFGLGLNEDDIIPSSYSPYYSRGRRLYTRQQSGVAEMRHDEKEDEHGFVRREFTRKYSIPGDYQPESVVCAVSKDGILTITAAKKAPEPPRPKERTVPILAADRGEGEKEANKEEKV